jgi:hypothetical protein
VGPCFLRAKVLRVREPEGMSDRDIWIKAGAILAEHGGMTPGYIIDQLTDVLDSDVAVKKRRRIAGAVDAITGAKPR